MDSMTEQSENFGYEYWLKLHTQEVQQYAKSNDIAVRDLPITAHLYNTLRMNGIAWMSQLVVLTPEEIGNLSLLQETERKEILLLRENYLTEHRREIIALTASEALNGRMDIERTNAEPDDDARQKIKRALRNVKNREKVSKYFQSHYVPIGKMELSNRSFHALYEEKITDLSAAVLLYPDGFSEIANLGSKSIQEIITAIEDCILTNAQEIENFLTQSAPVDEAATVNTPQNVESMQLPDAVELYNDSEQFAKIIQYYTDRKTSIESLNLSVRANNALRRAEIEQICQALKLYPDGFTGMQSLGKKTADEICRALEAAMQKAYQAIIPGCDCDGEEQVTPETPENMTVLELLHHSAYKEKAEIFLKANDIALESMNLSARPYNALMHAGYKSLLEILYAYPHNIRSIGNIGAKSVAEIHQAVNSYIEKLQPATAAFCSDNMDKMTVLELLHHPTYKEKAECFLKANDVVLESMNLSVRSYNALMHSGYKSLLEILYTYPGNLYSIRNIGAKSIAEIQQVVDSYMEKLRPYMATFCSGDENAMHFDRDVLYSDEYITRKLLACFKDIGFGGLSFQQMRGALTEEISEERIKKCIGSLLAAHKLEYADFRCYRVYPSVFDVLEKCTIEPRDKEVLRQRLSGKTLEEIGSKQGITRERVRQIFRKTFKSVHTFLKRTYGLQYLDEDFYTYLYENYDTPQELWSRYIGVSEKTFHYLSNTCSHGSKPIEEAMNDPVVYVSLKFRIRDYLNRNMLMIDGILLENRREVIENYAMEKYCRDEMTYDDFMVHYNDLLQENGIPFNEKLYYTDGTRRGGVNRLSDSMCCLWKQGERLRYYNIAGRDYSELLETLNLEELQNTEVSTLKFMNDYPAIMAKYDIRDQYELHNLLKKVVDPSTCQGISFARQPMIRFGQFDRNQAIYEIIETFSPISSDELKEYLQSEYGYDQETVWNYLLPFMKYYHSGVFSVSFKKIPEDRVPLLQKNLPDDFYFLTEVKEIYHKLFQDADLDEINHHSLKMIGYTVLGKYMLTRHKTADSFFREILLKEDVFSIAPFTERFGYIRSYTEVFRDLWFNMDILLFEKEQYLNIRRLEKLGITKADLMDYCSKVFEEAPENTVFTVHSLKDKVDSKLNDLGFDGLFYGGLLAVSGKFLYARCFGSFSFYKGALDGGLNKRNFCLETLKAYDSVELDDYIADCYEKYGIQIPNRHDVLEAISGTEFYYDNIMQKIYRNKNVYYAEFDD